MPSRSNASYFRIELGPDPLELVFDFARLSFHVPKRGSRCADRDDVSPTMRARRATVMGKRGTATLLSEVGRRNREARKSRVYGSRCGESKARACTKHDGSGANCCQARTAAHALMASVKRSGLP